MNITDSKFYRDKCFINGEWVGADSGETISVNNPATLKEIGTVPKCGTNETKREIEELEAKAVEARKLARGVVKANEARAAKKRSEATSALANVRRELAKAVHERRAENIAKLEKDLTKAERKVGDRVGAMPPKIAYPLASGLALSRSAVPVAQTTSSCVGSAEPPKKRREGAAASATPKAES